MHLFHHVKLLHGEIDSCPPLLHMSGQVIPQPGSAVLGGGVAGLGARGAAFDAELHYCFETAASAAVSSK